MTCQHQYECYYCALQPKGCTMSRRYATKKKYGILNFLFDLLLILCTGGLWLIWIFVREMRNR